MSFRHFSDLCASVLLSYQQAVNRNALDKKACRQTGIAERQLSGAGAALCSYARQMRSRSRSMSFADRRIRERLTQAGYDVEALDMYEADGSELISVSRIKIYTLCTEGHSVLFMTFCPRRRRVLNKCGKALSVPGEGNFYKPKNLLKRSGALLKSRALTMGLN